MGRGIHMSDIPEARRLLQFILKRSVLSPSSRSDRDMLEKALSLMTREPVVRKTPAKNISPNANMVQRIRELAASDLSQVSIANMVGTNPGRVSEVLSGRRNDQGALVR